MGGLAHKLEVTRVTPRLNRLSEQNSTLLKRLRQGVTRVTPSLCASPPIDKPQNWRRARTQAAHSNNERFSQCVAHKQGWSIYNAMNPLNTFI